MVNSRIISIDEYLAVINFIKSGQQLTEKNVFSNTYCELGGIQEDIFTAVLTTRILTVFRSSSDPDSVVRADYEVDEDTTRSWTLVGTRNQDNSADLIACSPGEALMEISISCDNEVHTTTAEFRDTILMITPIFTELDPPVRYVVIDKRNEVGITSIAVADSVVTEGEIIAILPKEKFTPLAIEKVISDDSGAKLVFVFGNKEEHDCVSVAVITLSDLSVNEYAWSKLLPEQQEFISKEHPSISRYTREV